MKRESLKKILIEIIIKIVIFCNIYYVCAFICLYFTTTLMGKSNMNEFYKTITINNLMYFEIIATSICYIFGMLIVYILIKDKMIGFLVPLVVYIFSNILASYNYNIGMFLFGTQSNMMIKNGKNTCYILIIYIVILIAVFMWCINKNREELLCGNLKNDF